MLVHKYNKDALPHLVEVQGLSQGEEHTAVAEFLTRGTFQQATDWPLSFPKMSVSAS